MNLFPPLDAQSSRLLDELMLKIEKIFPVPRRFAHALPRDVGELSRLFTAGRGDRGPAYLGKPNLLSAYLNYFLPWNVYRLCRLLPSVPLELNDEDIILDIGSGPLTFALALWISRPDFRNKKLEFYCLDKISSVLEAGKQIFAAFTGTPDTGTSDAQWKVNTLRGEFTGKGFFLNRGGKRIFVSPGKILNGKTAALVTVVNMFNEIFWELSPHDTEGLNDLAEKSASALTAIAPSVFIAEPGIPRSGEFITSLRSALSDKNYKCISPCLHEKNCPFPGGIGTADHKKNKWCHFSFVTDDSPMKLRKLSEAAGIPKERAVLSFLLSGKFLPGLSGARNSGAQVPCDKSGVRESGTHIPARVISDSFPVDTLSGRYACSIRGAVLVKGPDKQIAALESGSCVNVKLTGQKDVKSGALVGAVYKE